MILQAKPSFHRRNDGFLIKKQKEAVRMNKEETVIFDRKMLVKLIVPMVIEQLLSVTVGMADMIMVREPEKKRYPAYRW